MFHRLKPGLKPGLKLAAAAFGLAALLAALAVRADEPVVMPVPPQPTTPAFLMSSRISLLSSCFQS